VRRIVLVLCAGLAVASAWASSAVSSASGTPVDVATRGFGLHMKLTLPRHWQLLPQDPAGPPPSEMVTLVHVGTPSSDESQWWGPDIMLVNGAQVHRPADVVSRRSATPDASKFVPWPSDFFAYLSKLPGVEVVSTPRPVSVRGARGTGITIRTPPMHPIIWLKGDHAWIGGGPTGVDPALTRRIVLLNVKGKKLLLAFADTPARFRARWPLVQQLFGSIRF
jgi:hypothetical protein